MLLRSRPVLCNYYVTYRCNASCSFCDIWEKPSPYVTEVQVAENLKALKKLGVKVIDFTGGEPLLHRGLPVFLKMARDLGFITTVTTNGLLYPKYADTLRGLIDMLHFSLDSSEASVHDTGRGVACFDKVMQSIEVAKSLGERPDILFTAMEHNIAEIEKIYHNITLPHNLMLIINPVFSYNEVGGGLSQDHLETLRRWGKKKLVYLNDAFVQLRLDGGNHVDRPVCKAASTTLVISPENKLIVPCYHLGHETYDIEGNLYELYHRQEVKEMRAMEGRLPGCEGCVVNCYMQPSFAVAINKYWLGALPSTLKYNLEKGTWKRLLPI
jgi:MoaA/NifB/PqqE/SkfB family radical SAM enzyme